jgi:hypothetical protein
MKKCAFAFLLIGLLLGVTIGSVVRQKPKVNERENKTDQEVKNIALGKLFPSGVGLRVLKDMRILMILNSNDVVTTKSLLLQDLDLNVSSLSGLSREVELSEFDKKVLQEGERFLKANEGVTKESVLNGP